MLSMNGMVYRSMDQLKKKDNLLKRLQYVSPGSDYSLLQQTPVEQYSTDLMCSMSVHYIIQKH
jgi:hypothetical protein